MTFVTVLFTLSHVIFLINIDELLSQAMVTVFNDLLIKINIFIRYYYRYLTSLDASVKTKRNSLEVIKFLTIYS